MSIVRPPDDGAVRDADHLHFQRYYQDESGGGAARRRAAAIRMQVMGALGNPSGPLRVAEIGCGDGTGCRLWAERGHEVHGADHNAALVALARKRAGHAGLEIAFDVAQALALPWPDRSMDVCIAAHLLDDTPDWRACLDQLVRVLKPGGVLYVSGANHWYPGARQRHALSYYTVRKQLRRAGLAVLDRFDLARRSKARSRGTRAAIALLCAVAPLRLCAHVASRETIVLALKPAD